MHRIFVFCQGVGACVCVQIGIPPAIRCHRLSRYTNDIIMTARVEFGLDTDLFIHLAFSGYYYLSFCGGGSLARYVGLYGS